MTIFEKIKLKRDEHITERDKYKYDHITKQIEAKETELNDLVAQRNHKKVMFDLFQHKIDALDAL